MTKYTQEIEAQMVLYFSQLLEKDQRHYAALEAAKLGYGGKQYICKLFNISQRRIRTGVNELSNPLLYSEIPINKQRRLGGGRKKKK